MMDQFILDNFIPQTKYHLSLSFMPYMTLPLVFHSKAIKCHVKRQNCPNVYLLLLHMLQQ